MRKTNSRKYYRLGEAAQLLECTTADLIYRGVHSNLPIYVLAAEWRAYAHKRKIDSRSDLLHLQPDYQYWESVGGGFVDRLNGPRRLHVRTVQKFESASSAAIVYLLGPVQFDEDLVVYEYRLAGYADNPDQPCAIVVNQDALVILAEDLPRKQEQPEPKAITERGKDKERVADPSKLHATAQLPQSGFLREAELIQFILPFSASTLWRKVKSGDFPAPSKLSAGVTAWRVEDIRQWLESRRK